MWKWKLRRDKKAVKPAETTSVPPWNHPPAWDELLGAAQRNRPMDLWRLVKQEGMSPDHTNGVGQTALHVAALWGHVDCVSILVSKDIGANPNAMDFLSGATPLHAALQSHKIRQATRLNLVIQVLLQAGADKDLPDAMGFLPVDYIDHRSPDPSLYYDKLRPAEPPMFQAIRTGNFNYALALFYSGRYSPQELAGQVHNNCTTVQAVVDLLVSVVDPFAQLDDTMQLDFDLLQILLACGASPLACRASQKTYSPMKMLQDEEEADDAKNMRLPPMIRLLDRIQDALRHTMQRHSTGVAPQVPPIIHLWLQACQALRDCHEAQQQKYTAEGIVVLPPLLTTEQVAGYWHNAARRGHLLLLQVLHDYLPSRQFSVHAVNRQGMTALHFAARSGQMAVARFLLSLPETKVALRDHHGQTALDAAVVNGHEDMVDLLRRHMAAPHVMAALPHKQ